MLFLASATIAEDLTLYKEYKSEFSQSDFSAQKATICPTTFSWACMGPPCGMHGCTFYSGTLTKNKPKADQLDASFFASLNHLNSSLKDSYKRRLTAYQDNLRQQYVNQTTALKEMKSNYAKNFAKTEHGITIADQEYLDKLNQDEFMQDLHDLLVANKVDSFLKINKDENLENNYSVAKIQTLASHISLNNSCRLYKFTRDINTLTSPKPLPSTTYANINNLSSSGPERKSKSSRKNSTLLYKFDTSGGLDYAMYNKFLSDASIASIASSSLDKFLIPENKISVSEFKKSRRDTVSKNLYTDVNIDGYVAISSNKLVHNQLLLSENAILEGIELKLAALLAKKVQLDGQFTDIGDN